MQGAEKGDIKLNWIKILFQEIN